MDILVTSVDKPQPRKLFSQPEGLQILSLINPFPNQFHVLVLSKKKVLQHRVFCSLSRMLDSFRSCYCYMYLHVTLISQVYAFNHRSSQQT